MDYKKKIEIPFGAFDSELIHQEINIPNGFKAVIDGNKIILTRVESEDEKIRKAIHIYLDWLDGHKDYQPKGDYTIKDMLAWLEKQGKQKSVNYDSNEDERIRKELIAWLKNSEGQTLPIDRYNAALAWLEKQGEQKASYTTLAETGNGGINALVTRELSNSCDYEEKPVGKVEPKFKVGDWVVNKGHSYLIADIDFLDNRYLFEIGGYTHEQLNWEYIENVDNKYHLWTIQDAKDGDVLAEDTCIFIIKKLNPNHTAEIYCCLHDDGDFELNSNLYFDNTCTYPATKEQRNLLFQKMKEAGYEWDAEKKELKKISQRMISAEAKEAMYNKPADTVEQKFKVKYAGSEYNVLEIKEIAGDTYYGIEDEPNHIDYVLPDNCEIVSEQKSAWSEEDEYCRHQLIVFCENCMVQDAGAKRCAHWLKSLRPQTQWKPSDEQMELLKDASARYEGLQSLYNDLKKIKGE